MGSWCGGCGPQSPIDRGRVWGYNLGRELRGAWHEFRLWQQVAAKLGWTAKGDQMLKVQDLVEARLYASEEQAIQDALRYLLRARPDLRIQLAIHRYQTKEISLAKAASLAGVSWAQMREILLERGIQPRLGPETLEEARREVQALRDYFQAQS